MTSNGNTTSHNMEDKAIENNPVDQVTGHHMPAGSEMGQDPNAIVAALLGNPNLLPPGAGQNVPGSNSLQLQNPLLSTFPGLLGTGELSSTDHAALHAMLQSTLGLQNAGINPASLMVSSGSSLQHQQQRQGVNQDMGESDTPG